MNILNENVRELGEILSVIDNEKRAVAYAGFIMAFIELNLAQVKGLNKGGTTMFSNELYYAVNEIAIIDKELMIATANKIIAFYNNPITNEGIPKNSNDIFGLNFHLGNGFVESINNNIDLFIKSRSVSRVTLRS